MHSICTYITLTKWWTFMRGRVLSDRFKQTIYKGSSKTDLFRAMNIKWMWYSIMKRKKIILTMYHLLHREDKSDFINIKCSGWSESWSRASVALRSCPPVHTWTWTTAAFWARWGRGPSFFLSQLPIHPPSQAPWSTPSLSLDVPLDWVGNSQEPVWNPLLLPRKDKSTSHAFPLRGPPLSCRDLGSRWNKFWVLTLLLGFLS